MFFLHPSHVLQTLFKERPFQGANPSTASFLFLGLDANFAPDIETVPHFPDVCEYLKDGVRFWQARSVHHPFLLPGYHRDGALYHKRFAKIGFLPEHAPQVSFVELIDVPTYGKSHLREEDIDDKHMARLEQWIFRGTIRYVFVPPGAVRLLRTSPRFSWLKTASDSHMGSLPVLYSSSKVTIFAPYHFSCVGQYCPKTVRDRQLADIGALVANAK